MYVMYLDFLFQDCHFEGHVYGMPMCSLTDNCMIYPDHMYVD
jgi:hypothetical protein